MNLQKEFDKMRKEREEKPIQTILVMNSKKIDFLTEIFKSLVMGLVGAKLIDEEEFIKTMREIKKQVDRKYSKEEVTDESGK